MLIINLLGFALIMLIVWWFWLYKPKTEKMDDGNVLVVVENGVYQPSHISLASHQAHDITFLRKDASPCAETVSIPALGLSETLILNKPTVIHIPHISPGEYHFHCQMQMYKGVLKVE